MCSPQPKGRNAGRSQMKGFKGQRRTPTAASVWGKMWTSDLSQFLKANSSKDTGSPDDRLDLTFIGNSEEITWQNLPSLQWLLARSNLLLPCSPWFSSASPCEQNHDTTMMPWRFRRFLTKPTRNNRPRKRPPTLAGTVSVMSNMAAPAWKSACNGHFLLSCAKIRIWLNFKGEKLEVQLVCFTSDVSPFRTFVIWCWSPKTACMASFLPWRMSGWHEHGQEKRLLQCWLIRAEHSNCEVNQ